MDAAVPLIRVPVAVEKAHALIASMGDPHDSRLPCSYRRIVERDEREVFAEEVYRSIDLIAPSSVIRSRHDRALIARTIALRDPGLAFAWASNAVGYDAASSHGDHTGHTAFALVLSASNPVVGTRMSGGYRLSGECPLTPHPARATAWIVEADVAGSSSGVLFLLQPAAITAVRHRVRTVGLRTAELGACRLRNAFARDDRVVAILERREIEMSPAASMRLMSAAISLGLADTVLRAAVAFAHVRVAYGRTILEIPHVRALLADAAVDLLAADSVLSAACEASDMPVRPHLAGRWISRAVDRVLANARVVLGARGYLREGYWDGIVEKMLRDQMMLRAFPEAPRDVASRMSEDDQAAALFVRGYRGRESQTDPAPDNVWFAAGIDRLTRPWRSLPERLTPRTTDVVLARLLELFESERLFSLLPITIASRTALRSDCIPEPIA